MGAIDLSEHDKQILELGALRASWSMICGEFHSHYGGPGALALRLTQLEYAGLLEVCLSAPHADAPSVESLEADALAHACYEEMDATLDPLWEIVTTDKGMALISSRLEPE